MLQRSLTHLAIAALCLLLSITLISCNTLATLGPHKPTIVKDKAMAKQLLGTHPLSLQWISWHDFGTATVTDKDGVYHISGEQRGKDGDFVKIKGVINRVDPRSFWFDGVITIQVSHINDGIYYGRRGLQKFALYGDRRFWRLTNMENPDGAIDYVDLFFDLAAAKTPPAH